MSKIDQIRETLGFANPTNPTNPTDSEPSSPPLGETLYSATATQEELPLDPELDQEFQDYFTQHSFASNPLAKLGLVALGTAAVVALIAAFYSTVWPGSGLTINLTEMSESVKQVWLDDPSQVTLDYAGELCATPCGGGVQVLHLKRIKPLNFANLPATPRTTLTVVTVSPQGERVYKFLITYGAGNPTYLAVNLSPTSPVGPRLSPVAKPLAKVSLVEPDQERIALLERGLFLAREQLKPTTRNRLVLNRAAQFLADLKQGYPESEAIKRNHLSANAVATLANLGQKSGGDREDGEDGRDGGDGEAEEMRGGQKGFLNPSSDQD